MSAYLITTTIFPNNPVTGLREMPMTCYVAVHRKVNTFASTASHLVYSQYRLDGVPALGIRDGLIDLGEVIEFHEAVKGKLPCPV